MKQGDRVIDWPAIRARFEAGSISLNSLAHTHGVNRQAIRNHAAKEHWVTPVTAPLQMTVTHVTQPPPPVVLPIPADAVDIARAGLKQLAEMLERNTTLEVRDHKSLSDALGQYVKVIVTAPPREDNQSDGIFIPMSKLSAESRQKIRAILLEDAEARAS
jgi:hypothetical protein